MSEYWWKTGNVKFLFALIFQVLLLLRRRLMFCFNSVWNKMRWIEYFSWIHELPRRYLGRRENRKWNNTTELHVDTLVNNYITRIYTRYWSREKLVTILMINVFEEGFVILFFRTWYMLLFWFTLFSRYTNWNEENFTVRVHLLYHLRKFHWSPL